MPNRDRAVKSEEVGSKLCEKVSSCMMTWHAKQFLMAMRDPEEPNWFPVKVLPFIKFSSVLTTKPEEEVLEFCIYVGTEVRTACGLNNSCPIRYFQKSFGLACVSK